MAMFVLLSAEQADHVRGPSVVAPSAALNPIRRQGGLFILRVDVLSDIAHEFHRAFLSTLPQLDDREVGFPAADALADT